MDDALLTPSFLVFATTGCSALFASSRRNASKVPEAARMGQWVSRRLSTAKFAQDALV